MSKPLNCPIEICSRKWPRRVLPGWEQERMHCLADPPTVKLRPGYSKWLLVRTPLDTRQGHIDLRQAQTSRALEPSRQRLRNGRDGNFGRFERLRMEGVRPRRGRTCDRTLAGRLHRTVRSLNRRWKVRREGIARAGLLCPGVVGPPDNCAGAESHEAFQPSLRYECPRSTAIINSRPVSTLHSALNHDVLLPGDMYQLALLEGFS